MSLGNGVIAKVYNVTILEKTLSSDADVTGRKHVGKQEVCLHFAGTVERRAGVVERNGG